MSKLKLIKRVKYRKLLHDEVPLSFYDIYQDEERRYALLTFYNSTLYTIKSFKIKITFFTASRDKLNTLVFGFEPKDFFSHKDYAVKEPLLMPLEADGFNYEILDVEIPTREQNRKEKLRMGVLPEELDSKVFTTGKEVKASNLKKGWLFLASSLLVALAGTTPFVMNNLSARDMFWGNDSSADSFFYDGGHYLMINDKECSLCYIDRGLSAFSIPKSVKYFGKDVAVTHLEFSAFENCYLNNLSIYADLEYNEPLSQCHIQNLEFYSESDATIPSRYFSNCNIESVYSYSRANITLSSYCFEGCKGLTFLYGHFEWIWSYAFTYCYSLTNLDINGDKIDSDAFYQCNNIQNANLNYNSVAVDAFKPGISYNNHSLEDVDLLNAITC